jgi:hypothetical protein
LPDAVFANHLVVLGRPRSCERSSIARAVFVADATLLVGGLPCKLLERSHACEGVGVIDLAELYEDRREQVIKALAL